MESSRAALGVLEEDEEAIAALMLDLTHERDGALEAQAQWQERVQHVEQALAASEELGAALGLQVEQLQGRVAELEGRLVEEVCEICRCTLAFAAVARAVVRAGARTVACTDHAPLVAF